MTTVVTLLLAGAGIALADRQRGPWGILGALGTSQLALHAFLEFMSGSGAAMHQHGHHGAHLAAPVMTIGHVAVVIATGLAMTRAEQALFVVARLLRAVLPRRTGPLPVVTPPPAVCIPAQITRTLAQLIHRRIQPQRGPPKSPFHNFSARGIS